MEKTQINIYKTELFLLKSVQMALKLAIFYRYVFKETDPPDQEERTPDSSKTEPFQEAEEEARSDDGRSAICAKVWPMSLIKEAES